MCVCVCVRKRERDRERERAGETKRERDGRERIEWTVKLLLNYSVHPGVFVPRIGSQREDEVVNARHTHTHTHTHTYTCQVTVTRS